MKMEVNLIKALYKFHLGSHFGVMVFTLIFFIPNITAAQSEKTQTVRGQVIDDVSRSPLVHATITIEQSNTPLNTITDNKGNFVLKNVPLDRHLLRVSCVGYETQTIPEILVTSGKEVVLLITLSEKVSTLNEVVVHAKSKRALNNDMALVSGVVFNPDDTRRFAGAVGDPSRMINSMAGVASASDTRNDIVVRGNSPAGLLWRVEGVDIPNPNHYGSLSSTGGPVSMLNSNNLERSEFFTGAFPAQYGNALSSAFDLNLRNGNAKKNELIGEISFTGVELGAEGPFSSKSEASYIVNYRYSTIGIMNSLGFNIGTGAAVPQYQDLNFKVHIPLSQKTKLAFWGLGGPSKINFYGDEMDTSKNNNLYGNENENILTKYFTGITGVTLETNFSNKTFGKMSLGYSYTYENLLHDSISVQTRMAYRNWETNYKTNRYTFAYNLSHKFNAKNNIVAGVNATLYNFNLFNALINDRIQQIRINQNAITALLQAYTQWKHRFSEKLSFTAGLHFQELTLNNSYAFEPRAALKYDLSGKQSFSLGYGMHSQMQSPLVYFFQTNSEKGIAYTNKELGFTKSQHFVLGYTNKIAKQLLLKMEMYYQHLSNVPVTSYASGYSMLNDGADFVSSYKDSLVNNGSGNNYGVELTVEKFFSSNYYFLITSSIFNSKYKGSDGIERNTAFNTKYVVNVLAGKDCIIGKNKNVLTFNFKVSGVGGKYTSPVNVAASAMSDHTIYDEIIAPYSLKQTPYFRADLKMGYRCNYKKSTLEAGIDLENITGHKNIFIQNYDRRTGSIINQYQQGFLPVPYVRFTF